MHQQMLLMYVWRPANEQVPHSDTGSTVWAVIRDECDAYHVQLAAKFGTESNGLRCAGMLN
jgi:hypothetical protein